MILSDYPDERIISSQRYINPEVVEEKSAEGDLTVVLSTPFFFDGEYFRLLLDGHHRLVAAIATEEEPDVEIVDLQLPEEVCQGALEELLDQHWIDSDWYDVRTGILVW